MKTLTKAKVQAQLRATCRDNRIPPCSLDRDTKWKMFVEVCSNLLEAGSITHSQFKSWTNPF